MPTLDEMKDAIAGTLEDIFGSWESTAWLIDSAVTMLTSHVGDVRDDVKKLCKHMGLKNEDLRPKKRRASISAQNELNRRSSVKSMIPQELLETGSSNDKVSSQALPPPQVAPSANAPPAVSVTSAAAEPPSSTSARAPGLRARRGNATLMATLLRSACLDGSPSMSVFRASSNMSPYRARTALVMDLKICRVMENSRKTRCDIRCQLDETNG